MKSTYILLLWVSILIPALCSGNNTPGAPTTKKELRVPFAPYGVIYLDSLSQLSVTTGLPDLLAIVTDSIRGGVFYYTEKNLLPDSGTIFQASDTGYWVRSFSKIQGYNVDWFGAKGDGQNFDETAIQLTINAADTGAVISFRPNAKYLIAGELTMKNYQVLSGNKAVLKRAAAEVTSLQSNAPGNTNKLQLTELPTTWKPGDKIHVYIGESVNQTNSIYRTIVAINGNEIELDSSIGNSNDNSIDNWPAGASVRKVFSMVTTHDPNSMTSVVAIKNLIFDGNKAQNSQNLYWGVNSTIFVRGLGSRIENCVFFDIPNENITGHGLMVENCQAYNLNGSFIHLTGIKAIPGQAHSIIKGNYTEGSNLVPNAVSGHSEAVITTSFTGGLATITDNRFYNGNESVIGHINPPTDAVNDMGTSDLIFQNNICKNFKKIVYQIIDPIFFGYADSARNIIISNNVFSNCGTTDWSNYGYFLGRYIGLKTDNNVLSEGTQWLMPPPPPQPEINSFVKNTQNVPQDADFNITGVGNLNRLLVNSPVDDPTSSIVVKGGISLTTSLKLDLGFNLKRNAEDGWGGIPSTEAQISWGRPDGTVSYGSLLIVPRSNVGNTAISFYTSPTANTVLERLRITPRGSILVNKTTDDGKNLLQVQGRAKFSDFINLQSFTPANSNDPAGEVGDASWDNDAIYIKTTNGWKKAPLAEF